MFIWKPISCSKSYNSFRLTVDMSALFCEQQDVGRMKYTKNVLMRSLILFAAIYQMHAVLNLLIIHEKQKIKKIILLLVKQNRKLKNSELEGSKDKKKKIYVVQTRAHR